MINRETCPMMPVVENEAVTVGVIGAEQGVGASFICGILERELKTGKNFGSEQNGVGIKIVDLGECKGDSDRSEVECLLIVADGSSPSKRGLHTALKVIKNNKKLWAVVFNKCSDDFEIPQDISEILGDLPCFRIPFIQIERFTELYNFIFYS